MRVEAVHHIEQLCECRRLLRQIGRRAAAENQNIDLVLPHLRIIDRNHRHIHAGLYRRGSAPREHGDELHILICLHGVLHAAAEIAIAKNTNTNHKNSSRHPPRTA